jgi:para-nitrobenzyl esterase
MLVEAPSGAYRGSASEGVQHFRGIRYAQPPLGSLRLAAPQSIDHGPQAADAPPEGSVPLQRPVLGAVGKVFGSAGSPTEDSLTLDIRAPRNTGTPRPVLVWVHGGGFLVGGAAHPLHGTGALAREGIVEVIVSYRLGILGFGHFDDAPQPANRGVLDVIEALRWVQRNITAFGGDPTCVTLGGHSSGAMVAAAVVGSGIADGLFHRLLLQSGAGENALAEEDAGRVTRHTFKGAPSATDFCDLPAAKILDLQSRVCAQVMRGTLTRHIGTHLPNALPWQPVIDGCVLRDLPTRLIGSGAGATVPVLCGTTADEGWLPVGSRLGRVPLPTALVAKMLGQLLGSSRTEAAEQIGRVRNDHPDRVGVALLSDVVGRALFDEPAARLADARADANSPTFVYQFVAPSTTIANRAATLHGADVAHMFGSGGTPHGRRLVGASFDTREASALRGLWARFIAEGAPTTDATWPSWHDGVRTRAVVTPRGVAHLA